ncbi:MAG: hypothetical protein ABIO44_02205 [Saprospiraceae bacterium]
MRIWLTLICAFNILSSTIAQNTVMSSNDSLEFWSDVMFNAHLGKSRGMASKQTLNILTRLVESKHLDDTKLNPNIVKLKFADQNIELYSWQCELDNNQFEYYGFVKKSDGTIESLTREVRDYNRIRTEEFNSTNWYGAVYYYLIPKTFGLDKYYVLFGFAQNENNEKFKIIETVKINNNELIFGTPVFDIKDEDGESHTYNRQIIKYSQSVNCQLRYEELDSMIVYDHIINYQDPIAPQIQNYFPDGSYEAFEYSQNQWKFISKLKTESVKDAPREKPVLDNKTKDLLGREKKK